MSKNKLKSKRKVTKKKKGENEQNDEGSEGFFRRRREAKGVQRKQRRNKKKSRKNKLFDCRKPKITLPVELQNIPLFNMEYAFRDELDEYNGWSLGELLFFLQNLWLVDDHDHIRWEELELPQRWDLTPPEDRELLWNKLKGNLRPPTLKESILCVRKTLLAPERFVTLLCLHNEWPKLPRISLRQLLEDEIQSVLDECPVKSKKLVEVLGPSGISYLLTNKKHVLEKYILSVADFFKKYPGQYQNVRKRPRVLLERLQRKKLS